MLGLSFCLASSVNDAIIAALPFGDKERCRLLAIKNPSARLTSLAALISLDRLLKVYGVSKGDAPTILREDSGKPYFAKLPLSFSLSHADGLAISALSDTSVGVDIEWLDRTRNIDGISGRFFTSLEQSEIFRAPDKPLAFYSLWTKKEAYAKLTGEGLVSVCSSKPLEARFKQYILEFEGRRAIISICTQNDEQVYIHDPEKEFTIYELQN